MRPSGGVRNGHNVCVIPWRGFPRLLKGHEVKKVGQAFQPDKIDTSGWKA